MLVANHAEAEEVYKGVRLVTHAVAPNNALGKEYEGWCVFSPEGEKKAIWAFSRLGANPWTQDDDEMHLC